MNDICLVGFGAIGAFYAFALERSSKAKVTAVCRSNFDAIEEHGLDIVSDKLGIRLSWKPHRLVRTVEQAADRKYSMIICAFKCLLDLYPTSSIIEPLLKTLPDSPETALVLLQNGIGIEDELEDQLSKLGCKNRIISGCAWVDTTAIDGGRKVTQHGNERLVLGYHKAKSPFRAAYEPIEEAEVRSLGSLCRMLESGGASAEPAHIDVARWRKVLWNSSFSTLCSLARCTVGDILSTERSRTALIAIMEEVLAVARACLPAEEAALLPDTVATEVLNSENPASTFKPSMLVDLEAGRPMEVEAIVGGILKRARQAGMPTPRLDTIYATLIVMQQILVLRRGSRTSAGA